jgi:hypothetical protein
VDCSNEADSDSNSGSGIRMAVGSTIPGSKTAGAAGRRWRRSGAAGAVGVEPEVELSSPEEAEVAEAVESGGSARLFSGDRHLSLKIVPCAIYSFLCLEWSIGLSALRLGLFLKKKRMKS